ncbi:hypothetical protein AMATHDRAFT_934 [Amanita thiersii Skay4041]|uniref:Muskelin N-terminal domain-containing protein n=1 Tax=Amanita thiersii Skay4041 TaxID=703135 RepID=A0A2A9NZW6_9AGAR|nr:hypothetical protein AMATHDRAFT_934 [Amanita thiersii Skay4041]
MSSGLSQLIATSDAVNLSYSIAASTPHSGQYGPENILVDNPTDHTSRWSSAYQGIAYQGVSQWILLRLESLSVLQAITFGKFMKAHPCNLKDYRVFVGTTEDHMTEVLHSQLRNDHIPETRPVKHMNHTGIYFPTRFVKIVPLSAHQSNYHTSVWHISLQGIQDPDVVERVRRIYEEYREAVVLRHLLKHLRQRRLLSPFDIIQSRSFLKLEHPLVTQLHSNLVLRGNWSHAEQLLLRFSSAGLFKSYLQSCQPNAAFTRLRGTDADGDMPCARGGHAMCMDPINDRIYLHGGWDGEKSLDDFLMYDVKEDKWTVLSLGTAQVHNAPSSRSCHKMLFDTKSGSIYILGRLSDSDQLTPASNHPTPTISDSSTSTAAPNATPALTTRPSRPFPHVQTVPNTPPPPVPQRLRNPEETYCSEFYRYHTRGADAGTWDFLSFDTASSGGPPLVFDHQMVLDPEAQMIYVFGGRIVDGNWDSIKCAGLYSYNVRTSKWKTLMPSDAQPGTQGYIPPRFGHSMLFEPNERALYIFAGQKEGVYLSDMYVYDLKTNTSTEIFSESASIGGPEPSFAPRAVIDPELKEIYIISGLVGRHGDGSKVTYLEPTMSYWVYRYGSRPGKWSKVHLEPFNKLKSTGSPRSGSAILARDRHVSTSPPLGEDNKKPRARYAYQVTYNIKTKKIFMHGGNAGKVDTIGVDTEDRDGDGGEASGGERAPDQREAQSKRGNEEMRLNDLWSISLQRPLADMVVRRARFQIRRQQFREMCEDQSPIKALNFLQNEVADVVDHSDVAESEEFRALMTYLLMPPPGLGSRASSAATIKLGQTGTGSSNQVREGQGSAELNWYSREYLRATHAKGKSSMFELYSVDERDDEDEEADEGSDRDNGGWTNHIEENNDGSDEESIKADGRSMSVNPDAMLDVPDPVEFKSLLERGPPIGDPTGEGSASGLEIPSGLRYQQRAEVFESLLEFVDENERQPNGSLLDLVGEGGAGGCLTGLDILGSEYGLSGRFK